MPEPTRGGVDAISPPVNFDDAPIVAAALDAGVDYFVTGDRRLRNEIGRINPPFRVLTPRELIEEITNE